MGCKLGRMKRLAETSGGREIETVSRSSEGLQAEEEHRRIETVSESVEWRQVEDTPRQERMRIIEPGEGSEMEVVGEGWQVQEAQEGRRSTERLDEPGEGLEGQEAQARVSQLGQGGQVHRAEEIQERTEVVEMRLRPILHEEEMGLRNGWEGETDITIQTLRTQIRILEYILDRPRMIAEGDVPGFLHHDAVHYGSRRGALPFPRATVDGLPSILIQQQEHDDGNAFCAVCLEVLAGGESAKQLPCLHFYHSYCILRWLQSKNSCPVCRREIPAENPH